MISGEIIRKAKFFDDGNVVVVATDHGGMNGPVPGLENYVQDVGALKKADAFLLLPAMISRLLTPVTDEKGELTVKGKIPKLILRLNWMTNFFFKAGYKQGINCEVISVADAVMLGANAVMASLQLRTGEESVDAANMNMFTNFVSQKRKLGVPIFAEIYPGDDILADENTMHEYVRDCCRISAEQGADMIKTFYTGKRFSEIVNSTPIPIFALGASKCDEVEALQKAYDAVNAGAKGVVFGRNVFQSGNPERFVDALLKVVKKGEDPVRTAKEMGLN